jgi:DNA invertase Pin-like site-specific DNA recombinase
VEQLISFQTQRQAIGDAGKRRGDIITGVYVDMCSSSRQDRPGLANLSADASQLKFDVVFVADLWRLFENVDIGYEISEVLSSVDQSDLAGSLGEHAGR